MVRLIDETPPERYFVGHNSYGAALPFAEKRGRAAKLALERMADFEGRADDARLVAELLIEAGRQDEANGLLKLVGDDA